MIDQPQDLSDDRFYDVIFFKCQEILADDEQFESAFSLILPDDFAPLMRSAIHQLEWDKRNPTLRDHKDVAIARLYKWVLIQIGAKAAYQLGRPWSERYEADQFEHFLNELIFQESSK